MPIASLNRARFAPTALELETGSVVASRERMSTGYAEVPPSYFSPRRPGIGRELSCGVIAGQVAGLAMAFVMMALFTTFLDKSPFYPLALIGRAFLDGVPRDHVSPRAIAVGLLVHQLGPSLVWGVVFGLVVWTFHPRSGKALLMLGLIVGAVAHVVDVQVILPAVGHAGRAWIAGLGPVHVNNTWTGDMPVPLSWIAHLTFGLGLSLHPWSYDPVARTFD